MSARKMLALMVALFGILSLPLLGAAGKSDEKSNGQSNGSSHDEQYTLEFIPTQNAPGGAQGTMDLKVVNGETHVHFSVRGAYPDTVYTIWTVFKVLTWNPKNPPEGPEVPAGDPPSGFPSEGNGVSPTARLDDGFTSGMGQDPGASFVTNDNGDGEVQVNLDFNLVQEAPVSNKDMIIQCAPAPALDGTCTGNTEIGVPRKTVRVTTTWLRRYIGEFPPGDRASNCANYDANFDPDVVADPAARKGQNAQLWQCTDPATGLPRVYRFQFDHFRLANHPDDLTHGFIGGNATDHFIDMVGRRCDLVPPVGPPCL